MTDLGFTDTWGRKGSGGYNIGGDIRGRNTHLVSKDGASKRLRCFPLGNGDPA